MIVTKLFVSWMPSWQPFLITWQPSLKLTNWEGKVGAKHNLPLASRGLRAVILYSQLTEFQSSMKGALSTEVLTRDEAMSTTLMGPQRTEITQPENSTYPCFHCQLPWGTWWPEIFTELQYSPETCLAVGFGHRRGPHADELGRSRCDTHWKDPFSPKDRGSRDIHSWGDYSFRWVNKNTEISIDSKKISEYWEFLPVERPINLDGRDSPSNYRKKDLGH